MSRSYSYIGHMVDAPLFFFMLFCDEDDLSNALASLPFPSDEWDVRVATMDEWLENRVHGTGTYMYDGHTMRHTVPNH